MYLCKFGQNPFTGSEDNAQKLSYTVNRTDADGIHTETNKPPVGLGVGGHKHKAYICKPQGCSHDIFTYKFANGELLLISKLLFLDLQRWCLFTFT